VPYPEKVKTFEGLRRMDAPQGTQAGVEGVDRDVHDWNPKSSLGKIANFLCYKDFKQGNLTARYPNYCVSKNWQMEWQIKSVPLLFCKC
jgi:hypothetical protein